jgi:ankyrin repeat protein
LFLAVKEGHLEVVNALLEVGGRELVMLTRDNGVSCLFISAKNGHLEVVRALLEVGGRELVMLSVKLAVKEFQGLLALT